MRIAFLSAAAGALLLGLAAAQPNAALAADEPPLPKEKWSFDGVFGTFDRAALQRGFQVYQEVCSACHGLYQMSYRDLAALGYSEEQIAAIASQKQVTDGPNDEGEMYQRPARPSDKFVRPFPNEQAARAANNGAYPPDLSTIVKAREGGANYVYGILTGYTDPPPDFKLQEGMNYNEHFPGHQIAMPKPLNDGAVTFADNTPNTLPQEAHDVVTFLTWASEPALEQRHRTGVKVMLFLIVGTVLFYFFKRRIWADVH
jgi:ubiquinol-cytochrome c reductase cytochrome c1 subunit